MTDVKRRSYDASGRQERARANRRAMLAAAIDLLERQGYASTTLAQVAESADVATATAYKAFGNKPALVKAAFDYAAAGDDDPTPIPQRAGAARIMAEPDPTKKLEIYTMGMIERLGRVARLHLIARAAAEVDPEMAEVRDQIEQDRLRGMAILATHLADGGHLRTDVGKAEARDVLWTYNSPELFELLVINRGWSRGRYRAWVHRALVSALLP